MSMDHTQGKLNLVGKVTFFRLFLWWGTEVVKKVLTYRRPEARIIHLFRCESVFPVSKWVFSDRTTCYIISGSQETGVEIYKLRQFSQN